MSNQWFGAVRLTHNTLRAGATSRTMLMPMYNGPMFNEIEQRTGTFTICRQVVMQRLQKCPGGASRYSALRTGYLRHPAFAGYSACLLMCRQLVFFFAAISLMASPANASDLAKPEGEILLTVSGNISTRNHTDGAAFDLQMLEAMPVTTFVTETPWTEGPNKFSGVRLKYLLETVGAKSKSMKMTAEDGYIFELDMGFDDKYPVIIAYKKNDDYMSLRELGPLWVMLPFDDFPELQTETYRAASVWQLTRLEIR